MLTACNITGSCVSSRTACLGCGQHLNTQGAARLARIVSQQMQGLFAATLGGAMLPRSGCSGSATSAEHVSMRLPPVGARTGQLACLSRGVRAVHAAPQLLVLEREADACVRRCSGAAGRGI